jgi:Ni/Fe-hydrogenase subunit HybB-like protein
VFFLAVTPQYAQHSYVPALAEFALTLGLILCIVLCFRAAVRFFPVLPPSDPT